MNTTSRISILSTVATGILAITPVVANPQFQNGNLAKYEALADELDLNLTGQCVGYGYAIYHNEGFVRGGGGGVRRRAAFNRPSLPFTAWTRKGCHSMSKAITAAAMLRALQIRNISVDTPVYPHMPKKLQDAVIDNDMETITFRQLLAHRSGVPEGGWRWSDLLQGAATTNPTIGDYDYANWNYALCRTLIPYVLAPGQLRGLEILPFFDINLYCASRYTDFAQNQVLIPAGIPNATWRSPNNIDDTNFSYYYDWNNPFVEEVMPNRFETIGSGGWAMSSNAYAKFMAKLQSGSLLPGVVPTNNGPESIIDLMRDSELGMFDRFGTRFYAHSGANTYTNGNNQSYGGRSQWVFDTNTNITVCVQVNCSGAFGTGELQTIIIDAIRNAFDETATTSAPLPPMPPEDAAQLYLIASIQSIPTPDAMPERALLPQPILPELTHRSGTFSLQFDTVPGATHVIETLQDGLWVPTTAIPGDGLCHTEQPETREGTKLFRVNTLMPLATTSTAGN